MFEATLRGSTPLFSVAPGGLPPLRRSLTAGTKRQTEGPEGGFPTQSGVTTAATGVARRSRWRRQQTEKEAPHGRQTAGTVRQTVVLIARKESRSRRYFL